MVKATIEFDDAKDTARWQPAWFGSLRTYAAAVDDHAMSAVKRSVARGRAADGAQLVV